MHEAVHNAVVPEEVAKMAYRAETINPNQPAPQSWWIDSYYRKVQCQYGQKLKRVRRKCHPQAFGTQPAGG